MYPIKYIITYTTGSQTLPESAEITYTGSNPILARRLAINELKRILAIAEDQQSGKQPDNMYGIGEWDSCSLIHQTPELNSILVPFSVNLLLDLDGNEYVLFGEGVQETLEALWAETHTLKQSSRINASDLTGILQNITYSSEAEQDMPPFLFCDGLSYIPEFEFKQFDIVKSDCEFLLGC